MNVTVNPDVSPRMTDGGDNLPRLCARVAWRLLPLLFLGMLASYLDRVNVGFAKLRMLSDLSMSEASYGLGTGLFFLGYILCEVPSNAFMMRFGARRWLARILITWGICSGAMALVHSASMFYVLRLLLGIAEAGFMPGVLFYLSQWFPPAYRARVTGWFMVGIPLASVIGGPVSGLILGRMEGAIGIEGWRWLFFLEAMPPVLLGILIFFRLPDRIETAHFLSADEKALLMAHRVVPEHTHILHGIRVALRDSRIWKLGLADGALLLGLYTIAFWVPSLLRDAGVRSMVWTGILTAIPNLGATLAIIAIGRNSDRTGERRWHIVIPIMTGALMLALLPLAHGNLLLVIILITLANMGIIGSLAPFWALPSLLLKDPATVAAGLAMIGGISNLAGFMATGLIGWARSIAPGSWSIFVFFAACVAAGGMLVWSIPELDHRKTDDRP